MPQPCHITTQVCIVHIGRIRDILNQSSQGKVVPGRCIYPHATDGVSISPLAAVVHIPAARKTNKNRVTPFPDCGFFHGAFPMLAVLTPQSVIQRF